jgi:predicted Zn-dependent peptidase
VPSCSAADEGRFASYVLNTMLGGGMSSRLFQNIREKRGLAYSVFSEQYLYRDAGCLSIYAGTSLATVRQVIDLILDEFRDLKCGEPPAEELRRAKDHLKGSLILGLESTSSRMSNNARQYLYYNRFTSLDEMAGAIEAVTGGQVAELANRHFTPGRIAVTVLGNIEGLRRARGDLAC